jgi:NADH dehydrogenase
VILPEPLHVITGAFGYSGSYIARLLLAQGQRVRTLTNSPRRSREFGGRIEVHPLAFHQPERLVESLRGAAVLYNTYWVRFNHRSFTQADAVANTLALFDAAKQAGVGRIVHVSITNPSLDSPLEYFRGKARLERALVESGMAYTILRPAILFGGADILVNNIAWALRRLPVFGVFGTGRYRLQPIHVEDFAALAAREGGPGPNRIIDATGPETFTYRELVQRVGEIIGCRRPIMPVPPALGFVAASILGLLMRDVVLTRAEIAGLMAGLLATDSPPAGTTRLTDWARSHANELGRHYASELARRRDREKPYEAL